MTFSGVQSWGGGGVIWGGIYWGFYGSHDNITLFRKILFKKALQYSQLIMNSGQLEGYMGLGQLHEVNTVYFGGSIDLRCSTVDLQKNHLRNTMQGVFKVCGVSLQLYLSASHRVRNPMVGLSSLTPWSCGSATIRIFTWCSLLQDVRGNCIEASLSTMRNPDSGIGIRFQWFLRFLKLES